MKAPVLNEKRFLTDTKGKRVGVLVDLKTHERLILQRTPTKRARLVRGKFGRPVLVAPAGAPPMTPDRVKTILNELP